MYDEYVAGVDVMVGTLLLIHSWSIGMVTVTVTVTMTVSAVMTMARVQSMKTTHRGTQMTDLGRGIQIMIVTMEGARSGVLHRGALSGTDGL